MLRILARWLALLIGGMADQMQAARAVRRWRMLRRLGMTIGDDVVLPSSTWVDASHAYLISIGNRCTFGEECLILSHDAQMDEFLDAGRIGRVVIHDDCFIGPRTTILPGVEIGPRTVVLPHSVVGKSLPPETVCGGNPARVVTTLAEHLERAQIMRSTLPTYDLATYDAMRRTPTGRAALARMLSDGGFIDRRPGPGSPRSSA